MNRHGEVNLVWGDGEQVFRLAIAQIRELQEKTNCGPLELLNRMVRGTWRLDDVRETIRLGLIGGGLEPIQALSKIARYVDARPLSESVPTAQAILSVMIFGKDEEDAPPMGEQRAKETDSQTAGSPSPASTELVQ